MYSIVVLLFVSYLSWRIENYYKGEVLGAQVGLTLGRVGDIVGSSQTGFITTDIVYIYI